MNQGQATGGGIMKTHPATAERIEKVKKEMPSAKVDISFVQLRSKRFEKALK